MKIYVKDDIRLLHPKEWDVNYSSNNILTITVGNEKIQLTKKNLEWYSIDEKITPSYGNTSEMMKRLRLELSKKYEPVKYMEVIHWEDGSLAINKHTKTSLQNSIYSMVESSYQKFVNDQNGADDGVYSPLTLDNLLEYKMSEYNIQFYYELFENFEIYLYEYNENKIKDISNDTFFELLYEETRIQTEILNLFDQPVMTFYHENGMLKRR